MAACLDKVVKVINPATNEVTASVPAECCWNVAVGGGQVWVPIGDHTEGFLRRGKLIPQVLDLGPDASKLRFLLADRLRVCWAVCIEAFKSPTWNTEPHRKPLGEHLRTVVLRYF